MHEHTNGTSLVGSVFERPPSLGLHRPPQPPTSGKTGFPAAQHRSKSAFARRRDEERKTDNTRPRGAPTIVPIPKVHPFTPSTPVAHERQEKDVTDWREEISRQNQMKVQNMSAEERERERNEIYEKFGADIGDILRRARMARERQAEKDSEEMKRKRPEGDSITGENGVLQEPDLFTSSRRDSEKSLPEVPITSEKPAVRPVSPPLASFPPPSLSASATRPSTPNKALRKIRFAELSPTDVHVYESAPPSPRKKTVLALPPPPPTGTDEDIVSLGMYPVAGMASSEDPEEGSPEYIRRKYFPSAPSSNPNLAWMEPSTSDDQSDDSSPIDKLRFDLSGNPIPSFISLTLPTHLGLHHHAEGSHAGYTLDDIFLLTRSSVAAQRAAMLGVLSGIARWLRNCVGGGNTTDGLSLNDLSAKSAALLKRILFAGLEVLPERGSVGARGIAVVWQCLVGWEAQEIDDLQVDLNDVEVAFGEVELNIPVDISTATTTTPPPSISSLIDALPLPEMLSQLAPLLSSPPDFNSVESSPTPNQLQLLAIVHRISKHSKAAAEMVVQTSSLVASIISVFLLSTAAPHPPAIQCLITLASASRQNAKALCDPADAMLKFVTSTTPSADGTMQYPAELAHELLVSTLRLYTYLGRYGMYSHTATDAQELWIRLAVYATDTGGKLAQAWAELISTWMVCATDPHRTSPSHDILWSRVVAWGWGEDVLALTVCDRLPEDKGSLRQIMDTQGAIWRCISTWLEGSRVNSIRGGQAEREAALTVLKAGFEDEAGLARQITLATLEGLKADLENIRSREAPSQWIPALLSAGRCASALTAVIRLWLACTPSSSDPPESPPFSLPFSRISQLCALLVSHPVWGYPFKSEHRGLVGAYTKVMCRPLASLLYYYLLLSKKLPGSSGDLWMAQAFAIILRCFPGDEDYALAILDDLLGMITADWAKHRQLKIPDIIWERGGMEAIKPILHHVIQSRDDIYIAPLSPTPRSILLSTSQRLATSVLTTTDWDPVGLPLKGDWALTPIDHILRSGHELSVFQRKGSLPPSWDISETEIVRASLLLAQLGREAVLRFASGLADLVLSGPEAVFGCMKVFMLEHEQDHDKGLDEVFRDPAVGYLMNELVSPYTVGAQSKVQSTTQEDLETVAARFLGAGTPFYQYYTDFVALYDAISFAHPLFARLLLPPTSMRYAVDYRKHLWLDFGHLIKSIHVPLDAVISQDIREYLYPVEHSSEMIGAYIRALVTIGFSMDGFTRFVAVHHVACNIWSDLMTIAPGDDASAKKLFELLIGQGSREVLKEILTYKQALDGPILLAPHCFDHGNEVKGKRAEYILHWSNQSVLENMLALF